MEMDLKRKRSGKKMARNTIEKNRRIMMKLLCFNLVSLIPPNYLTQPKELLSQQDQIDHSVAYIEFLKGRVQELRRRKAQLKNCVTNNNMVESKQPILTVKELGADVEVVLISDVSKSFRLRDVIVIIEQEAAEVMCVSVVSISHGKIIHSIHAKVKIIRVGVDIARISERIHDLISSNI